LSGPRSPLSSGTFPGHSSTTIGFSAPTAGQATHSQVVRAAAATIRFMRHLQKEPGAIPTRAAVLSSCPCGARSTTFPTLAEKSHAAHHRGTRDGFDPRSRAPRLAGRARQAAASPAGDAAGGDRGHPPAAGLPRAVAHVLLPGRDLV